MNVVGIGGWRINEFKKTSTKGNADLRTVWLVEVVIKVVAVQLACAVGCKGVNSVCC